MVSCGVRLSVRGFAELRKPQVVRSIRIAGSIFLAHFDAAPLSNRTARSGFCHGSIGKGLGFPPLESDSLAPLPAPSRTPRPPQPLSSGATDSGGHTGLTRAVVEWRNNAAMVPSLWPVIANRVTADALTESKSIPHVSEPFGMASSRFHRYC